MILCKYLVRKHLFGTERRNMVYALMSAAHMTSISSQYDIEDYIMIITHVRGIVKKKK